MAEGSALETDPFFSPEAASPSSGLAASSANAGLLELPLLFPSQGALNQLASWGSLVPTSTDPAGKSWDSKLEEAASPRKPKGD